MIQKHARSLFRKAPVPAMLLVLFILGACHQTAQDKTQTLAAEVVNRSDRHLLELVAQGDTGHPVDILKKRVSDYDETQMADFTEAVLKEAVRQRPAFSYRNEFLVASKAFLPEEIFDGLYAEAFRRQWEEAAPVLNYIHANARANAEIPTTNLALLKHYYLKLKDPTHYLVLHPLDPTMNCLNEPTATSLQQQIRQILAQCGAPGVTVLAELDRTKTQRHALAGKEKT